MYSWVYGVDDFMENLLEMNIKMSYSVKTYWKVKIAKKKLKIIKSIKKIAPYSCP